MIPEDSYAFEIRGNSLEAGVLGGVAYDGNLRKGSNPELKMLTTIAENTWVHCVDDVCSGGEPVILLDLKEST